MKYGLRHLLEEHLSFTKHELPMSPAARSVLFRGSYCRPGDITQVKRVFPSRDPEDQPYPLTIAVTRTHTNGTKHMVGHTYHRPPVSTDTILEATLPEILNRANRVERLARRIKAAAAITGVIGLAVISSFAGQPESADAMPRVQTTSNEVGHTLSPHIETMPSAEILIPDDRCNAANNPTVSGSLCRLVGVECTYSG